MRPHRTNLWLLISAHNLMRKHKFDFRRWLGGYGLQTSTITTVQTDRRKEENAATVKFQGLNEDPMIHTDLVNRHVSPDSTTELRCRRWIAK